MIPSMLAMTKNQRRSVQVIVFSETIPDAFSL
jgi:hypothetical protein